MKALLFVCGALIIAIVLWDAFEAIILPRRITRRLRLTRLFYLMTWSFSAALARRVPAGKRRERYLSYYGPLSLIFLLGVWASGLVFGFTLLHWALGTPLHTPATDMPQVASETFGVYLYMSGVTFFTLGFGDVFPLEAKGRALAVIEAGTGFGLLAIVIGYLPVLYQSFSRREVSITMLDARAGSPSTATELLRRHAEHRSLSELDELLREWERWSADLLESHLSYPLLSYYRSQHDNQSWLAALTTILDTCALLISGACGVRVWQAQLTFAMARHAVVDISQIFNTPPIAPDPERLSAESLARMRQTLSKVGVEFCDFGGSREKLAELRAMYEPYVNALSCYLLMPLPPWIVRAEAADNWRTSAWGKISAGIEAPAAEVAPPDKEHVW
jgi:hypothetical protein